MTKEKTPKDSRAQRVPIQVAAVFAADWLEIGLLELLQAIHIP
jgi:hypothetical protein